MRRIPIALLILAVGLLSSCWGQKKKKSETSSTDSIAVVQSESTERVDELISRQTNDPLLFDAPVKARYLLSSAEELAQNKIVKFDFNKDGNEEVILLSRDHPNGVRILAERNDKTQNLINDIPEGFFFDQYGELKPEYSIQVTIVDLDGDNKCEVVISIGAQQKRIDSFIFYIEDKENVNYHYVGSIAKTKEIRLTSNRDILVTTDAGENENYNLLNREIVKVVQ